MKNDNYRLVDQQITDVVWDTKEPKDDALILSPMVEITRANNKVLMFSNNDFEIIEDHRAPTGDILNEQIGYEGETVTLRQLARNAQVSFEDLEASSAAQHVNLRIRTVKKVVNKILRSAIYQVVQMASNVNNYPATNRLTTLTGTSLFNDENSEPGVIGDTAKEAIRQGIGIYPNVCLIPAQVRRYLKRHPDLIAQFYPTSNKSLTNEDLAEFFGVKRILNGDGIYKNKSAGITADMWGKSMIFAYVRLDSMTPDATIKNNGMDDGEPAFMYTFRGRDQPRVEMEYEHKGSHSYKTPIFLDYAPKIVGPNAGYIISPAIA
jgi:hypothetical protein